MEYQRKQNAFTLCWLLFVLLFACTKGKIIQEDIYIEDTVVQTLSAYTIQTKKWISGQIPFSLDTSLSQTILDNTASAMHTIEEKTNNCIRFYARTSSNTDYLNITSSNSGCYSSVGRVGGGQVVNIGPGCGTVGIIMHELLHALGFWHEQSRTDRDNYVDILKDNIRLDKLDEFETQPDSTGVESAISYDFGSILHYKYNQFAKVKSLDTIVPKAIFSNVSKTELGQRIRLSDKDVKRIMWLYGCDKASCVRPNFRNVAVYPDQNTYAVGAKITFSCSIGTLYGAKKSECMSNSKWSGEEPKCLKTTPWPAVCTRPVFKNVTVSPYQYTYHVGDTINFSCSKGTLIGAGKSECMLNGEWSGAIPYCVRSDTKSFHYCDMGNCLDSWYMPSFWEASWQRHSGTTPTTGTGPQNDHTSQNDAGNYLLMEASGVPGSQFALAYSPHVFGKSTGRFNICMTFYYYMYGEDLDSASTLSVIIDWKLAWRTSGPTTARKWTQAVTDKIYTSRDYTYAVFFTRKSNARDEADVAIDDVFIGPCDEVYQYSNITASLDSKPMEYDGFK